MSFLKKTLASFGIGSARVDTILKHEALNPGQHFHVDVHVYGGATAQEIDNIKLKLCCRYMKEVLRDNRSNNSAHKQKVATAHVLADWVLPYAFIIEPGQERVFPVELDIPWNTPVTIGDSSVWLETGLDIDMAVDPSDKDV